MTAVDDFWTDVEREWLPDNRQQLQAVSKSVLTHLRKRLPPFETTHLFGQLPRDVVALTESPQIAENEAYGDEPLEKAGDATFYVRVMDDTGISREDATMATRAVFSALKRRLPRDEIVHVREMLPRGLREAWIHAPVRH